MMNLTHLVATLVAFVALTDASYMGASEPVPASNASWKTIATDGTPTARHEAALVGFDDQVYLMGGRRMNPVDVYDPTQNKWTSRSVPPIELHHFQGVVANEKIYLLGAMTGKYPRETPVERVITYTPATDAFEFTHPIPVERRRGGAGAVFHQGKIYLIGGITNGHMDGSQPWFDAYDPVTGDWQVLPDAPRARDHFQAAVIGNRLYAAGGRQTSKATNEVFRRTQAVVDVFDFDTMTWLPESECPVLPTLRAGNSTAAIDGKLIVAGGESGGQKLAHAEVDVLDPQTGVWTRLADLNQGRHGSGLAFIHGVIYTASGSGGRGGGPELNTTESFPWTTVAVDGQSSDRFEFVIPGLESASSITDQSRLLDAPAGKSGFVTVRDGHFMAGE
ncbi:MAG: hypothetical protein AAFV88_23915, partial [Planctomycetota bacterium]